MSSEEDKLTDLLTHAGRTQKAFPARQYAQLLVREGLEFGEELAYLTKQDLKEVGVKSVGHRIAMIRAFREEFGAPQCDLDQFPAEGAVEKKNPLFAH